jgi:dihydroxyacetone kinase-like predicted kinase
LNLAAKKFLTNTNWSWTETDCNKISFYKDDSNKFDVVSSSSSSPYTFTRTTAQNKIAPGLYKVQSFLTRNGEDVFVEQNLFTVLPNIAYDSNSMGQWTRIYQNLLEAYEQLSQSDSDEITLYDGTHVTYTDREKLLGRIQNAKLMMEIENGTKHSFNHKHYVRFS